MKVKIVKVKSAKNLTERLAGIGTFRISGPGPGSTRETMLFEGTRQDAEAFANSHYSTKEHNHAS